MARTSILFAVSLLLTGCAAFDKIASGERRVPVSKYAQAQFEEQKRALNHIRLVYDKNRQDVLTYVIGFDGTNNSRDCDLAIGTESGFLDKITNKPSCTTVRRLKERITEISFDASMAARRVRYYNGPGAFIGRFTNPLDSTFGYSSKNISKRALDDFLRETKVLPSKIKEVRLVVIGFSRGAAIARDFVNHAHREWNKRTVENNTDMWSTLMLYDTVATFQQDSLQLEIHPKTEQVIHFLSKNESRIEFRPIVDQPIGNAGDLNRLVIMTLPGSHSDVGVGYRFGAAVFADNIAHLVAQEMGFLENVGEDYSKQPLYGLVDSRGWRDKLSHTPSGYACGFKRVPQKEPEVRFAETEYDQYVKRLSNRGSLRLVEKSSWSGLRFNEPLVIRARSDQDEWDVVPIKANGMTNMETRARLLRTTAGKSFLTFLDGRNSGPRYEVPGEVIFEIDRHKGQEVQLELTGLTNVSGKEGEGIWFFVNGCVPTDGLLHQ